MLRFRGSPELAAGFASAPRREMGDQNRELEAYPRLESSLAASQPNVAIDMLAVAFARLPNARRVHVEPGLLGPRISTLAVPEPQIAAWL